MAPDSDQSKNPIKRRLNLISVIADWITITVFLGIGVKQDWLLIVLIVVAAVVIPVIAYRFLSKLGGPLVLIAFIGSLVLAIVAWSWLASSEVTPLKVNITDPQDGMSVTSPRPYVAKGTVSDPNARVYVIVRTLPVSEMWVQQPAIVDGGGNWQASVFFGNDKISTEESYQVIALATNDNFLVTWATGNSLRKGQKLESLPRISNKSSLITVTRPK